MECPECGYEVDEAANFCPNCRHQFRDGDDVGFDRPPEDAGDAAVLPASAAEYYEPGIPEKFSGKELQYLKVQLIQPAMTITLAVAVTAYFAFPQVQAVTILVRDYSLPVGGAICLLSGIIVGGIFYGGMSFRLGRFRGE